MAVSVVFVMLLPFAVPSSLRFEPVWILPGIEGLLLVALVVADPGRINRRDMWLRRVSIVFVSLLVAGVAFSTARLIADILSGESIMNDASVLLRSGSAVWLGNVIAFALLYWELDSGGPAHRAFEAPRYPDFAFPEQLSPDIAPPDWRATFVDYVYLAFTNAAAFSPTDVMPLRHWAKLTMALQSIVSIVILGLVIARAVNVLN